ncbi:MAG: cytochrome b [Burkholderiales bacterium]
MNVSSKQQQHVAQIEKYKPLAIFLHWLLAVAIIAQAGLGVWMGDIPRGTPERAYFFNLHKSVGIVIALFILWRIAVRLKNAPPELPPMPNWQRLAAKISHYLLYVCMIVLPLSGYIGSNFTKYGVKFFGYQIAPWGPENKAIYEIFNTTHTLTGKVMIGVILVHVLAALKHWLVDKDTVMARMLPGSTTRES